MKGFATLICLLFSFTTLLGESKKPNIIFILVDDMGYSDIGCYGGEVKTPNLDRLAQNGLRFTQMHNTSKCFPSRATLLTGLYAQDCGMSQNFEKFSNAVTLAEVLKSVGYRTLASGKHHSRESLFDRGFDRYFGLLDGATNHFNPGLTRDGDVKPSQKKYGQRLWAIDDKVLKPYTPKEKDFYSTDYYTKYAIDYLEEYKNEDKPFFLYLSYTAPHDPLQAWWEDVGKYKDTYKVGYEAIRSARIAKLKQLGLIHSDVSKAVHKPWDSLDERTKEIEARKMAIYAAMIDRVDQKIGELITKLEELGELNNTLIMFAADNGNSAENAEKSVQKGNTVEDGFPLDKIHTIEYWASLGKNWANVSNTPYVSYKNSSREGGICTPFIAHWPKGIAKPGSINKKFTGHFIDVMATIVDITGAQYPAEFKGQEVKPMAGVSFLPQLKGDLNSVRNKNIYWQWSVGKAVRQGKWKAVAGGSKWSLFDMEQDCNETNDLAKDFPEKLESMKKQWQDWYASTSAPALKAKGKKKGKK
ncbi:arylsulfatase [Lentisphaera marina]|uniref:arylsulfatase n=1 Tax=Lentisphaera marina TaxID=1111041 RepID=UPI0023672EF2|nr:arylsulfatase [Lentisphaera marina]MDD7986553.1 arylsulfatase [Lentisphaera marina]